MAEGEYNIHKVTVEPIEEIVTSEGTSTIVKIHGNTDESIAMGAKIYGLLTNSEMEQCKDPGNSSNNSRTFGFNSTRWGGCDWKPKGPKPNWASLPGSEKSQLN